MPFLTTSDGTTLFYKDWGTGSPVVLVHALGMSSAFWDYTIPFLNAQGFRCIAFDRRGHGRSDDPGRGYDLDTMTDDLHRLLEQLDLRDVTLVGHSLGGSEVIRYHTRHGQEGRVTRLVLIATSDCLQQAADNPQGGDKDRINLRMESVARDYPQWLNDNTDAFYLPEAFGVSPGIITWTKEMMRQTSARVFVDLSRMMSAQDLRDEIRRIRLRTLVIHGDKDASIPFWSGERIAQTIPGCVFKHYPGAPHGLVVSSREEVNQDLLAFIKE